MSPQATGIHPLTENHSMRLTFLTLSLKTTEAQLSAPFCSTNTTFPGTTASSSLVSGTNLYRTVWGSPSRALWRGNATRSALTHGSLSRNWNLMGFYLSSSGSGLENVWPLSTCRRKQNRQPRVLQQTSLNDLRSAPTSPVASAEQIPRIHPEAPQKKPPEDRTLGLFLVLVKSIKSKQT